MTEQEWEKEVGARLLSFWPSISNDKNDSTVLTLWWQKLRSFRASVIVDVLEHAYMERGSRVPTIKAIVEQLSSRADGKDPEYDCEIIAAAERYRQNHKSDGCRTNVDLAVCADVELCHYTQRVVTAIDTVKADSEQIRQFIESVPDDYARKRRDYWNKIRSDRLDKALRDIDTDEIIWRIWGRKEQPYPCPYYRSAYWHTDINAFSGTAAIHDDEWRQLSCRKQST